MLTSRKPMFFSDGISWEPYIAKFPNTSHKSLPKHFASLDIKPHYIWADLREFTRSANLAFQTGQKIDCILFQEILVSIQYRLLLLDTSAGSLDEVVHLGMLAFATNVFLQMQGLALRFDMLSVRLRGCIFGLGLQDLEDDDMVEFKVWMLFVVRVSIVSESKDSWIENEMRKTLKASSLTSWEAVRERLKAYLWIDVLHDKGGKEIFEDATNGSLEALENDGSSPYDQYILPA